MPKVYTLTSTEALDKALEDIREATGRSTSAEVLVDAIELYDLIIDNLKSGGGSLRVNGREIVLPTLEKAAGRKSLTAKVKLRLVPMPTETDAPTNKRGE